MTGTSRIVASLACFLVGTAAFAQVNCQSQWTPRRFHDGRRGRKRLCELHLRRRHGHRVYRRDVPDRGWSPGGEHRALERSLVERGRRRGLRLRAYALATFDDGSGPGPVRDRQLHVRGRHAGERHRQVERARRGSALGSGLTGFAPGVGLGPRGYALTVHDDGGGPALYVGGAFTTAGRSSSPEHREVERLDVVGARPGHGLQRFDDAVVRRRLPAPCCSWAASSTHAGGVAAAKVAVWSGASWSALGRSGVTGLVPPFFVARAFAYPRRVGRRLGTRALRRRGLRCRRRRASPSNIARLQNRGTGPPVAAGSRPIQSRRLRLFNDGSGNGARRCSMVSPVHDV